MEWFGYKASMIRKLQAGPWHSKQYRTLGEIGPSKRARRAVAVLSAPALSGWILVQCDSGVHGSLLLSFKWGWWELGDQKTIRVDENGKGMTQCHPEKETAGMNRFASYNNKTS